MLRLVVLRAAGLAAAQGHGTHHGALFDGGVPTLAQIDSRTICVSAGPLLRLIDRLLRLRNLSIDVARAGLSPREQVAQQHIIDQVLTLSKVFHEGLLRGGQIVSRNDIDDAACSRLRLPSRVVCHCR